MTNEFDRKVSVVASAWTVLDKEPGWVDIIKHFDLGFPYAWLVHTGMGTLKAEGKKQVTETYDFLLKAMELEDSEDFWSFWDLIAARDKGV